MIAYKVVQRFNDKLYSYNISLNEEGDINDYLVVEYIPGQPTIPKYPGSKLFFFKDLNLAKRLAANSINPSKLEVWSCEVDEKDIEELEVYSFNRILWYGYADIDWPADLDEEYNRSSITCSVGTCIVPALTLLEKVQ